MLSMVYFMVNLIIMYNTLLIVLLVAMYVKESYECCYSKFCHKSPGATIYDFKINEQIFKHIEYTETFPNNLELQ